MSGAEIIIVAQNRLMKRFKHANAISPDSAVHPENIRGSGSLLFQRLIARGVFIKLDDGRVYMDQEAANRFRAKRRKRALTLTLILILIALLYALLSR